MCKCANMPSLAHGLLAQNRAHERLVIHVPVSAHHHPSRQHTTNKGKEVEREKKARNLKKKLKQAKDLKSKKDGGETLLPEQIAKVIKINELIRELEALGFDSEGEPKAAAAAAAGGDAVFTTISLGLWTTVSSWRSSPGRFGGRRVLVDLLVGCIVAASSFFLGAMMAHTELGWIAKYY